MEIFYVLLVLLLVTRVFGEVSVRLGQPALVGELISGILLGGIAASFSEQLPVLSSISDDPVFDSITDLGVFFLMLLAGVEMRPKDVVKSSKASFLVAISGLLIPMLVGFYFGWIMLPDSNLKFAQSMFLGTTLSVTAVPVAVRVLMDLGMMETKAGNIVVSAAVFDDVLSLVVLAFLTSLLQSGGLPDAQGILLIFGRTLAFFVLTWLIGKYVLQKLGAWVRTFQSDEFLLSYLLITAFAFALLAEALHMHFILGAFVAGLFFGRQTVGKDDFKDIKRLITGITTGFLAPVFFASIGLHLDVSAMTEIPVFLLVFIVLAFLTKLVGAGLASVAIGLPKRTAAAVGIAMSARGAVELIIADIALQANLFDKPDPTPPTVEYLFSSIEITSFLPF